MSWSSVKRLGNEMATLEDESNRFVPTDLYYVIRITIHPDPDSKHVTELANDMLCSDPQPIAVYYSATEILLIFSCVQDTDAHHLGGDHHRLISKYALIVARSLPDVEDLEVRIIELGTQTQVITYIGWMTFQTAQHTMKRLAGGKITDRELIFRTEKELKEVLAKKNIEWDAIDSSERYGATIRLRRKKDKVVTTSLSEAFDARESKRYTSFVFG